MGGSKFRVRGEVQHRLLGKIRALQQEDYETMKNKGSWKNP